MDWSWNPLADKKFQFMDHSLVACIRSRKDKDVTEFFKLLSLCHTVMVEHKDGNWKNPPNCGYIMIIKPLQLADLFFFFNHPLRWTDLPGSFSWWRCPGDSSQEFRLCVSVTYAGHHHHQGDGTGENLRNAGTARLQLGPQAHVYNLYECEHTHIQTCTI